MICSKRLAGFLALVLVCGVLLTLGGFQSVHARRLYRPALDCVFLPSILSTSSQTSAMQHRASSFDNVFQADPCLTASDNSAATVIRTSPAANEGDVAVTRETIIEFERALDPASVSADAIVASSGANTLAARLHLSPDRTRATLFYLAPLPDNATVQVTIDGNKLKDAFGQLVDADGDGAKGGIYTFTFRTLSLAVIPGTAVCGRVVASELDSSDASHPIDRPLQGATITVDGAETTLRATTDVDGQFCLNPAPGSRFFAHIDGRTATSDVAAGAYYPYVGKAWEPIPGQTINIGTVYLPLVRPGTLQAVSETEETTIHFPQSVLDEWPDFDGISIIVPADSLFADDGSRGGKVGIAPVPPNRLPGQLPANLNFPVVITVQTDGGTNFDTPAPVCFPNLPDATTGNPLAAGAGSSLVSFNHDTGRWEIVGTMTVSNDGELICSDPGVGVRAPGWHGAQAGNGLYGGGAGAGDCAGCDSATSNASASGDNCLGNMNELIQDEIAEAALSNIPGIGCAISTGRLLNWASNCRSDPGSDPSCTTGRALFKGLVTAGSCVIPGAGGALSLASTVAECMLDTANALEALGNCQDAQCGFRLAAFSEIDVGFTPMSTNDDLINDQIRLLDAYDALIDAILGDPRWADVMQSENAVLRAFYEQLLAKMADGSSDGLLISAGERGALLGLARPSTITETDANTLIDRMNDLASGALPTSETDAITAAALLLEEIGTALQAAGWETIMDGALGAPAAVAEAAAISITPARLFYKVENLDTGAIMRGRLSNSGTLDDMILPPDTLYEVSYVHADTLETASVRVLAGSRGDTTPVPPAFLSRSSQPDPDDDKLANDAEATLGTDPNRSDSDGDGMKDGDEIQAGRDPLGFPFDIGDVISATIDTRDEINRYTFSARGGQTVFLDTDGFAGFVGINLRLMDDLDNALYNNWIHFEPGIFTLERGGTYRLTVGDGDDDPHPYQITVWDVPAPDEFTINAGDVISGSVPGPGAGRIETPGVKDVYTFTALPGEKVKFDSLLPPGFVSIFWRILDEGGTQLDDGTVNEDSAVLTLEGGTYRIIVGNDANETVGAYQFQLVAVP